MYMNVYVLCYLLCLQHVNWEILHYKMFCSVLCISNVTYMQDKQIIHLLGNVEETGRFKLTAMLKWYIFTFM